MKSKLTFYTIAILFCLNTQLSAQRTVTWIGGTPGQETDWFCYKNWSNYNVPDEFTDVVIVNVSTSTFHYPVIKSKVAKSNSIFIYAQGILTIEQSGTLIVHDTLVVHNIQSIINKGKIILEFEMPTLYANSTQAFDPK